MVEYISIEDLSRTYNDISAVYAGQFASKMDGIKEQARTDVYRLFRNRNLGITKQLRKTVVPFGEQFKINDQFCLLIESANQATITIEYSFSEDDTTVLNTDIKVIDADTKTYFLMQPENYATITSTEDITIYKIDDSIFNMFYAQILAVICESGSLNTNPEDDIWSKRASDLMVRVSELVNSIIVYDENGDGEVTEEDLENQSTMRNCRLKR